MPLFKKILPEPRLRENNVYKGRGRRAGLLRSSAGGELFTMRPQAVLIMLVYACVFHLFYVVYISTFSPP